MSKIKAGITIGDPNGIGLEIILSVFEDLSIYDSIIPILFAPKDIVEFQKNHFKKNTPLNYVINENDIVDSMLNIVQINSNGFKVNFGKVSKKSGELSIASIDQSINYVKAGKIDVLVTAPINKNSVQSEKFKFPGHTDYLNVNFYGSALMFMISNQLRIALVTDHIPIKKVSEAISMKLINHKIEQVSLSLKKDFKISNPKIAVLGLNPHCGDHGAIGEEDDLIIKPAINKSNFDKTIVCGPFSADSFFGSNNFEEYDAILAIYHDQGLIPFKTLSFGSGVNFTAGLDLIRTSPDHGTAFDIAGLGEASVSSFKRALEEAVNIYKARNAYSSDKF